MANKIVARKDVHILISMTCGKGEVKVAGEIKLLIS